MLEISVSIAGVIVLAVATAVYPRQAWIAGKVAASKGYDLLLLFLAALLIPFAVLLGVILAPEKQRA